MMPRVQIFLITFELLLMAGTLRAAPPPRARPAPAVKPDSTLLRHRQRVMAARPLAMYYAIEDARALQSAEKFADHITVLGPQSFTVDAEGIVHGAVPMPLTELAQRKNLPIMPLLVNAGFDRAIASAILRNPRLQERTASYLAYLAQRENFVGWQLDLEQIDPADKARYTAFVRRVAAKLHRDGRLLSLAVTPRFSEAYPDARAAQFRTGEWGAPFDFPALGRSVDFMVIMTYDHHTSGTAPGPVAGYDWICAALDYAASRVPPRKLVMAIPFYGREWVTTPHGVMSRSLDYESLRLLLARVNAKILWHDRWRTPWTQFRDEPDTHTVWFDDRRSYREKLNLLRKYRLRGFAAWRLGIEDPEFWNVAAEFSKVAPAPQRAAAPSRTTYTRRTATRSR